jgi:hypothetical protein
LLPAVCIASLWLSPTRLKADAAIFRFSHPGLQGNGSQANPGDPVSQDKGAPLDAFGLLLASYHAGRDRPCEDIFLIFSSLRPFYQAERA